jgi:hypothetical protein
MRDGGLRATVAAAAATEIAATTEIADRARRHRRRLPHRAPQPRYAFSAGLADWTRTHRWLVSRHSHALVMRATIRPAGADVKTAELKRHGSADPEGRRLQGAAGRVTLPRFVVAPMVR